MNCLTNRLFLVLGAALTLLAAAGCGQKPTPISSAEEVKAFQGGPMTAAQIAEQDARRKEVMAQSKRPAPAAAR